MVNFAKAIKRPFSDFQNLSIGALMFMIPVVWIITSFFGLGQFIRYCKSASKRRFEMPEWGSFGKLFIEGIFFAVIAFIYSIPFIAASMIWMFSFVVSVINYIWTGVDKVPLIPLSGAGFVIILLGVLTAYVIPMAVAYFAQNSEFGSAFKVKKVFKNAFTAKYFTAWIFAVVYGAIVSTVITIIAAATSATVVLPFVAAGYGIFIGGATAFAIFGEVYGELNF